MITQQNHVFIDPENCGSGVGYYLSTSEYTDKNQKTTYSLDGTVVLSDCGHKIDWTFNVGDCHKIDAALAMLTEFRKRFLETEKLVAKLNKGN